MKHNQDRSVFAPFLLLYPQPRRKQQLSQPRKQQPRQPLLPLQKQQPRQPLLPLQK